MPLSVLLQVNDPPTLFFKLILLQFNSFEYRAIFFLNTRYGAGVVSNYMLPGLFMLDPHGAWAEGGVVKRQWWWVGQAIIWISVPIIIIRLSCVVFSCAVLSCLVLSRLVLSCLSCLVLFCLVL